ncbi:MazG nucleotide pyrophosphohydrolase domain-containing protein [Rothia nasisuis]|uniref:MazG nucleotide pyrophosphohydrolase domain-containing protein n=1 Tax=Rothia nasisuis TaxID=2109647 RepID=UPI001F259A33|nr:MazG nucleotide pyrophosphohydrolase domain-containing protein [Rothia nasisuis]
MREGQESQKQNGAGVGADFERLLELMGTLRNPGGCTWTATQTHESIMHYLVEETYEVVEAVEAPGGADLALLREELGDVLLNLIFHAQIASELPANQGGFSMRDVVNGLVDKLIRRNPHVFGDGQAVESSSITAQQIYEAWDELKKSEKPERTSPLDGIPPGLPALAAASKTQEKLEKVGRGVLPDGLLPEFATEEDLGAYLYALVGQARAAGLDPERALRGFLRRIEA